MCTGVHPRKGTTVWIRGLNIVWIWSIFQWSDTDGFLLWWITWLHVFMWTAAVCLWSFAASLRAVAHLALFILWILCWMSAAGFYDLKSLQRRNGRKPQCVKWRVSVLSSDNEALYFNLPSVPSHWFSLQWFIHKELHCFLAEGVKGI